jgi:hypothetical protein
MRAHPVRRALRVALRPGPFPAGDYTARNFRHARSGERTGVVAARAFLAEYNVTIDRKSR